MQTLIKLKIKIGESIRKIREIKGLKQESVAEKLNMSQANYSKIENNEQDINLNRLEEIAKIFEMPTEQLFTTIRLFDPSISILNSLSSITGGITGTTTLTTNSILVNESQIIDELIKSKNHTIERLEKEIEFLKETILYERGKKEKCD